MKNLYNSKFHQNSVAGASQSAEVLVPFLLEIIKPKSVIDIGCGLGAWLSIFKDSGIKDIYGIDGGGINTNDLLIEKGRYREFDLNNPISLNRKYDLLITLEVAEHLSERNSDKFVKFLTETSDIILFSAAVKRQGGVLHKNEQFPSYWQNKFRKEKYTMLDIRNIFLNNTNIEWWYRQNMFLIVKDSEVYKYTDFREYNPDFITIHKNVFRRYNSPIYYILHIISKIFNLTRAS